MKNFKWVCVPLFLALAGCSSNNSPTAPPTNTPIPSSPTNTLTPTLTGTPTQTATVTPTGTPTKTATVTPTGTSTFTATQTATPTQTFTSTATATTIPGIAWGEGIVSNSNSIGTQAYCELILNGQPVTNAVVVLNSPAMSGALTLPYYGTQNTGIVFAVYETGNSFNFQAGQPYTLTAMAGGVTSTAAVTAAGGVFSLASDGSAVSWTVDGNSSTLDVVPPGGSLASPSYTATGSGASPAAIPVSVYATPGGYSLLVDVDNHSTNVTGGTLVYSNRLFASAQYLGSVVSSPTPTFSPTATPTFTLTPSVTSTFSPTVTDSFTLTPTITETLSPTVTSTAVYPFVQDIGSGAVSGGTYLAVAGSGNVTIFAGDGAATRLDTFTGVDTGSFSADSPIGYSSGTGTYGIAWDATNQVFVVAVNHLGTYYFQKFTASGGNPGGGGPVTFGFPGSIPGGIAVDNLGNIYETEIIAGTVTKYNSAGTSITSWGGYSHPLGVAVDPTNSYLYVGNSSGATITRSNLSGGSQTPFAILPFPGIAGVYGVACDSSGNVFALDHSSLHIAYKYAPDGTLLASFGSANLSGPQGIAVDGLGYVYVVDVNTNQIVEFAPN